jgi:hypothetical protein
LKLPEKNRIFFAMKVRLHSFFHPRKIKREWEFSPGALIWRIFYVSTNRIVGEARDQNRKSASFFCLDALSGVALWKDLMLDEPWWVGIETVVNNVIICHEFARPDMPQHRGMLAIDEESGKLLWKNDALSYWFSDKDRVYGRKVVLEKKVGFALDLHTGAVAREYSDDLESLEALQRSRRGDEAENGLAFPEPFSPEDADPATAGKLAHLLDNGSRIQSMEYLLRRDRLLVDFYRIDSAGEGESSLSNILEIIDADDGKILHREAMMSGVAAPTPDAFFVKDDFLYFIKNRTTLIAMKLWKS